LIPQTGRRVHYLRSPNLYKSCVLCPRVYLRFPGLVIPTTIIYLGYPLGSFASLKHRQLAHQVGVIIMIVTRIRRTLNFEINLLQTNSSSSASKQVAMFQSRWDQFICSCPHACRSRCVQDQNSLEKIRITRQQAKLEFRSDPKSATCRPRPHQDLRQRACVSSGVRCWVRLQPCIEPQSKSATE
jgi:hypothetical protein